MNDIKGPETSDLEPVPLSAGEPDGMETTADTDELIKWHELAAAIATQNKNDPLASWHKRQAQLVKRLLAREAKAREEEREAALKISYQAIEHNLHHPQSELIAEKLEEVITAIRARTAPDPQSEIGLRAHLADLSARGLKP